MWCSHLKRSDAGQPLTREVTHGWCNEAIQLVVRRCDAVLAWLCRDRLDRFGRD